MLRMLQLTTILFLIAGSMLAVLHVVSLRLFLYWHYWWLDLPMHFLGGVVIALLVYTLYDLKIIRSRRLLRMMPVLLIVFVAALVWEGYEVLIGIPIEDDYLVDTVTDLIIGVIGGFVGAYVAAAIRKLG